jgi:hypothetical protein
MELLIMLKKLFTAALFILATSTAANAAFIDGTFGVSGVASTTLNASGEIVSIDFGSAPLNAVIPTLNYATEFGGAFSSFTIQNPLNIATVLTTSPVWSVAGFTFDATSIVENATNGSGTSLTIIGDVSHNDYDTTESQLFFSSQGLTIGGTTASTFSFTVSSPVPPAFGVSEPGTLAIFGLGLMGFAVSRKKKSA